MHFVTDRTRLVSQVSASLSVRAELAAEAKGVSHPG